MTVPKWYSLKSLWRTIRSEHLCTTFHAGMVSWRCCWCKRFAEAHPVVEHALPKRRISPLAPFPTPALARVGSHAENRLRTIWGASAACAIAAAVGLILSIFGESLTMFVFFVALDFAAFACHAYLFHELVPRHHTAAEAPIIGGS